VLLSLALLPGCSQGPPRSAPVDASKARQTLKRVLEGWKKGETPDSLKAESPSIIVQDMDWLEAMKLRTYELQGTSIEEGANLVAQVKMTLVDPQGADVEKSVTYVVGTAPVLTVFRDQFR